LEAVNRNDLDTAAADVADDMVIDFSHAVGPYKGIYAASPTRGGGWRTFSARGMR
jgi:hypothetical protein